MGLIRRLFMFKGSFDVYVKLIACARPSASLSIWVTKVTSPHEYSLGKVRSILMAPTLADSRTEGDFIFCIHHQQCRQGIKARRRVGAEWGGGGGEGRVGGGGRGRKGRLQSKTNSAISATIINTYPQTPRC